MAKSNPIPSDCGFARPALDVDAACAAAEQRVVGDVDLVLSLGLDHDPAALEVGQGGVAHVAVRVYRDDARAVAVVDRVPLQIALVDLQARLGKRRDARHFAERFLLDPAVHKQRG